MSVLYHTNGTTGVYVGRGTGGSLLGVSSAEGVKVTLTQFMQDIYSDNKGPSVPDEILNNGGVAVSSFELWQYNTTVLNNLLAVREGGGSQGVFQGAGILMLQGGHYSPITLASPTNGTPIFFPCALITDDADAALNTQLLYWNIKFRAVPAPVGTDYAGVLYQYL